MGIRENNIQSSEKLCNHGYNFITSFITPVLSSISYALKICFWHLVLLELISFDKIFTTVAQKFAIRCK